ncbi:MAG: hypothetical protein KBA72_05980 [Thermoanaerobaculia bacterium]|nr:hypothetical protein [Thermoanaerobaculia bacterium]
MSAVGALLRELFFAPFREMLHGLDAVLRHGLRSLLLVAAGLVVGWWVYVPLHELLHAFGCLAAGGEVSRLEIAPVYGGGWLSKLFPFVVPGGPYAGRLSGFDSHGSDWIYLATDLAPFALALFPGFWWLRRAAFAGRPVAFGAALPAAFAPLLSLSGDAYEIGSLATVHLPAWSGHRQLVGDDLGIKLAEIAGLADAHLLAGVGVAASLGLLWALTWMLLARRLASRLGAPAPAERTAARPVSNRAGGQARDQAPGSG